MDVRVGKKAEHWRTDAFELWCWRRLLRVPWPARRSNQSILKEISPGGSLEGLMLKLKSQYFGHLMRRADSFEKTLMLGKIRGRRRRGWQRVKWLGGITNTTDIDLGGLRELVMDREAWSAPVHGVANSRMWLSDWTEVKGSELLPPLTSILSWIQRCDSHIMWFPWIPVTCKVQLSLYTLLISLTQFLGSCSVLFHFVLFQSLFSLLFSFGDFYWGIFEVRGSFFIFA